MAPQPHQAREDFVVERQVQDVPLEEVRQQVAVAVHQGKLIITTKGREEVLNLPEDVWTDGGEATYKSKTLTICMPRKDPAGPAMTEKKMFDPDSRRRELLLVVPGEKALGGTPPATAGGNHPFAMDKTPAEASLAAKSPLLAGEGAEGGGAHYAMPAATTSSTVATSNPMMATQEGVVVAPSQGETLTVGGGSGGGGEEGAGEEVRQRLANMQVTADAPAGDEEATHGDVVRSEFVGGDKVAMVTKELGAADIYTTSTDGPEPISSMKQPGEKCEICACNPCQCDKYSTGRGGNAHPLEMTQAEMKRSGKPFIKHPHREITATNAHAAHDYQAHGKQVPEHHARMGAKISDYEGNVPEGKGDWGSVDPGKMGSSAKGTHAGGAEIASGPDLNLRGPTAGTHGARTHFHTLG